VRGLTCPNCGGALEIGPGLRVVACAYCATPLLVLGERGVRRFAVVPEIDSKKARATAREWLGRGLSKDPALRREAQVGEAFLAFLPFYRVEADCLGIALGTEERTRVRGSGKNRRVERYEVDVERRSERHFDVTYPAVNVAEWGLRRVDLTGARLVPFDADLLAREGMVFPPTGSEGEVLQTAVASFKVRADPSAGLKRLRFRFLESLRERLSVIYYPLWVVRYRFRGRGYQALVDAEDGRLAYGKAPGNDLYRAVLLVATEAAAAFIFTTVLQYWPSGVGLALGGLVALGLIVWGWKRFRYGGVVEEGTGLEAEESLAETLGQFTQGSNPAELLAGLLGEGVSWKLR